MSKAARVYMEGKRWPDGAICPGCNEPKRITARVLGYHPKGKGLAAAKVKRKIDREERKAKKDAGE